METGTIGSLQVSLVGLGCNNFGWRIDAAATAAVVDAAIDVALTFFDTADRYGKGLSEEFLGSALRKRRDEVIIATKSGLEMEKGQSGAAPKYVHEAFERSLSRLGTDRIDLYQLHEPDPETPIADTLGALNELVRAGKVREIGCSNFPPLSCAKRNRWSGAACDSLVCKMSSACFIARRKTMACWLSAKNATSRFFLFSISKWIADRKISCGKEFARRQPRGGRIRAKSVHQ